MTVVRADLSVCVGYANCVLGADDYFDEELGSVKILQETVPDEDRARVEEAVGACPVKALTLSDS
jgi:ferredoxin